jgi:hypothetical protein
MHLLNKVNKKREKNTTGYLGPAHLYPQGREPNMGMEEMAGAQEPEQKQPTKPVCEPRSLIHIYKYEL